MTIVTLNKISKTFKNHILFTNATASFREKTITGITGPNGSGKSVLFKMICGFIQPDDGTISIDKHYLEPNSNFPKGFGIIIDRPGFIENRTGFENLRRLAQIQKLITPSQIAASMKQVGLDPNNKQKVKHYSLGMKQKLSLVQAIMEDQDVLLLDEPFNALDHDSVVNIRELLRDYKRKGKTIILTSHNQEDINILCDDVYRIHNHQLQLIKKED
ncbi:ABC transporter ATP-binding protein [Alkalihalobacillus oceani]|uniref:ABC transporter ATP-binding protein n=1 Tax=Halalkalibacter oceani TaxID=1653776 RepID=A0A9X2DQA1_9BACI|nr:ABC transporter ATP-binding protein [Halalkalibacter oceani]MCM3714150.1 ABC transporter ATP-binding protein [Halalkalibacter oceani]